MHNSFKRGFALPTVLIASVILLSILTISVSATASVRTTLKTQYYQQLAQMAGEAGVAYAKACLATNGNVPLWTDAKPLTPSTDCAGDLITGLTGCPTDPRCSVTVNGNVRSSFSVPRPTLDSDGRAVTIPNTGYTEITRTSNGSVWRTYAQPSVQVAVVPDLCSGATSSTLGWQAVALTSTQISFSPSAAAQTISIADTTLPFGPTFYRKDFSVTSVGTYDVGVQVSGTNDDADMYIDGKHVAKSDNGSLGTASTALSAGCHHIFVRLTNSSPDLANNAARFAASVVQQGASVPVSVSDGSWRATAGGTVNFAHKDFYVDGGTWGLVRDIQSAVSINSGWTGVSGESGARWISTTHSLSGSNYPATQYSFFRDSRVITVTIPTEVRITYNCDDNCDIHLDGNKIATGVWNQAYSTTVTLSEGTHQLGAIVYNGSLSGSGVSIAAVRVSDSTVLTRTDASWLAGFAWNTTNTPIYSYDASFSPVPNTESSATVSALVVAGGGSGGSGTGGGGGGGGVLYDASRSVRTGSYSVIVGSGGASPPVGTQGNSGANSSALGITAIGGGGGGFSNSGGGVTYGKHGGSGGGGQNFTGSYASGSGVIGQGNDGGPLGTAAGAGGGGASGPGVAGIGTYVGGAGGAGVATSITGVSAYYGGAGGGAGNTSGTSGAGGIGGGTAGNQPIASNAAANTGGGGGGGWAHADGRGGAGGSGVVIISYPTGSMTATGGTITTSGGNTIHRFTSSGTFTVTSIN